MNAQMAKSFVHSCSISVSKIRVFVAAKKMLSEKKLAKIEELFEPFFVHNAV